MKIILNEEEKDFVNRFYMTNKHNKIDELIVDLPISTIIFFINELYNHNKNLYGKTRYKAKIKSHKLYIGKESE